MKKFFIILAAAALLVPAVSSCNKDNTPKTAPSSIKAPALAEFQTKLEFSKEEGKALIVPKDEVSITSIELTKSGKFIVEKKPLEGKEFIEIGKYQVASKASVGSYTLDGIGTIKIEQDGASFKVTLSANGETSEAVATEVSNSNPSGAFALAFQDWKVNNTTINVSGSGIPAVSGTYQGCDIPKIAKDIKDKGISVDERIYAALDGFVIKSISLTEFNTFAISFTGKDPFVGKVSGFNAADGTFNYKFDYYANNLVVAADAKVALFWKTASLGLTIEGNVNYNDDKTYKASVSFDLSPEI